MALNRRTFFQVSFPVLLLLTVLAAPATAQRDAYKRGVDLVEAGNFAAAVSELREAIQDKSEEKAGAFRTYLPHYYLGVALAETGDCPGALAAWAESERQGQIQERSGEHADLVRRKKACEEERRKVEDALGAAEQAIGRARKAASELGELQKTAELRASWKRGNPSFASRQAAAGGRIDEAAAKLAAGRANGDVALFQQARAIAQEAASDIDRITAEARERLGEIADAEADAMTGLENAEKNARAELQAVADLAPYPPQLGRRVGALEQKLQEIRSRKSSAGSDDLRRMAGELLEMRDAVRSAAVRPPKNLQAAAQAFLAGDYASVLSTLATADDGDPRTVAQVCQLRAASRYALWVYGAREDDDLRAALDTDIRTCGALGERPALPERFFSPGFVRFYEETLASPPFEAPTENADGSATDDSANDDSAAEDRAGSP